MEQRQERRRHRKSWTPSEWERAWQLAMMRLDGVPDVVRASEAFQQAVDRLNAAFIEGHCFRFELRLYTLLDLCAEAVNRGEADQWW